MTQKSLLDTAADQAKTLKHTKSDADFRPKTVKSFVRHQGRLTSGQQQAFVDYWREYGIDYQAKQLDNALLQKFDKVTFEIGFGNGETFIQMAENSPNDLFIGAEVHRPGVGRTLRQAHDNKLDNIRVIMHDAVEIIDNMLPESSLDRVLLFFPDPWHKKRHVKRRIIQTEFCQKLSRVIKPQAILHIATDWVPYAEHCLDIINPMDCFYNLAHDYNSEYLPRPDYRPETKFERRGLKLGHEIRDLVFINQKC